MAKLGFPAVISAVSVADKAKRDDLTSDINLICVLLTKKRFPKMYSFWPFDCRFAKPTGSQARWVGGGGGGWPPAKHVQTRSRRGGGQNPPSLLAGRVRPNIPVGCRITPNPF